MPAQTVMRRGDGVADNERQQVLDSVTIVYGEYAASGRDRRWRDPATGSRIALEERDSWLLAVLRPTLDGTIVDLGCGTGVLAVLLDVHGRPRRYVGIDLLEERLVEAIQRAPWGEFIQASADETPLETSSADAVVASTLFTSLTEPWFRERVAAEITRILKPGGRLVVYDFRYPSPGNRRVRPLTARELQSLFPNWPMNARTMTLLPPIARTWLGAGRRRYRVLVSLPPLRSHLGAVLTKPA